MSSSQRDQIQSRARIALAWLLYPEAFADPQAPKVLRVWLASVEQLRTDRIDDDQRNRRGA